MNSIMADSLIVLLNSPIKSEPSPPKLGSVVSKNALKILFNESLKIPPASMPILVIKINHPSIY
jgi:hypothetical protein